jgi:hypothetical protein
MQWEMMLLLVLAGPFVIYWLVRNGIASVRKRAEANRKQ